MLVHLRNWGGVRKCLAKKQGKKQLKLAGGVILHRAIQRGAPPDVVRLMLKGNPAAAKKVDRHGKLPLHYECHKIHQRVLPLQFVGQQLAQRDPCLKVVEALLKANPAGVSTPVDGIEGGELPLHIACRTYAGLDIANALLNKFPAAAATPNRSGELPLHLALSYSSIHRSEDIHDLVEALLKAYPEAASTPTSQENGKNLPLHIACQVYSTLELVTALLNVNPKAARTCNIRGELPIHVSLIHGSRISVIEHLLKIHPEAAKIAFPDDSGADFGGHLPLHAACEEQRPVGIVRALYSAFPEGALTPSRVMHRLGDLPIHLACRQSSFPANFVVNFLLQEQADCSTIPNKEGMLPLHVAVSEIARRYSQPYREKDDKLAIAYTASATTRSAQEIVQLLIDADPNAAKASDANGRLPLHYAAEMAGCSGLKAGDFFSGNALEILVKSLLEAYPGGATVMDNNGDLPLHLACRRENLDIDTAVDSARGIKTGQETNDECDSAAVGVVDALLAAHLRATATPDRKGRLPIHLVAERTECGKSHIEATLGSYSQKSPGSLLDVSSPTSSATNKGLMQALLDADPESASTLDRNGRTWTQLFLPSRHFFAGGE